MLTRRSFLGLIPVGLLFGAAARGGPNVADDPEAIARAFFDLLKREPKEFVAALAPEALAKFRELLSAPLKRGIADGEAEQIRLAFGVTGLDEIERLDDATFFLSVWTALSRQLPSLQDATLLTFGVVREGANVAHVPYRLEVEYYGPLPENVFSLVREEHGWSILPQAEFEGFEKEGVPPPLLLDMLLSVMEADAEIIGAVPDELGAVRIVHRVRSSVESWRVTRTAVFRAEPGTPEHRCSESGDAAGLSRMLAERAKPKV